MFCHQNTGIGAITTTSCHIKVIYPANTCAAAQVMREKE